jgi:hypothetical protein
MYRFLAALPAVLALSGFIAYQLLRRSGSGDDVTRRIVDKLRREAPNAIAQDGRLSADQVERVLRGDQNLQRLIGKQELFTLKAGSSTAIHNIESRLLFRCLSRGVQHLLVLAP